MDIKIDETKITDEELLERMGKALPADILVFAVTEPKMKPGKIAYASYSLCMEPEADSDGNNLLQSWNSFLEQDRIETEKKLKSGILHVDIKPDLQKLHVNWDGKQIVTDVVLPAGSEYNVNPSLLTETFRKSCPYPFFCEYTRHALYDASMALFE